MKRFLALLLALLMIVPATLVPASAAEVTAEGVKTNDCCEILITDLTSLSAFGDKRGTDIAVGVLDGYQAISLTSIENASSGESFKLTYHRDRDTAFAASEDVSEMTHVVFDLYISDASKIIDQQGIFFELGSDSCPDHYEITFNNTLEQLVGKTLKSGWNHVELPISRMTASSQDPAEVYDPAEWDFFRFFNNGSFPAGVKLGLANMYFMNADCEEHYSHDKFQFSVLDKAAGYAKEENYRIPEISNNAISGGKFRYMDSAAIQVYRFDGIDGDRISHATISATMGAQLHVLVSKSLNGPWVSAYQFQSTLMNKMAAADLIKASYQMCLWKDADGTAAWFYGSNNNRTEAVPADMIAKCESVSGRADLTPHIADGSDGNFDEATATYVRMYHPGSLSTLTAAATTIDLTDAIRSLPGDSDQLYVKFADSYPESGWGPSLQDIMTLDVRYDESIPEYVEDTVVYEFEVNAASEGPYLFDDQSTVAQDGNRVNYSRYGDNAKYFTYRFPLGDAKNADALYFTAEARAQFHLLVSTDNSTWVDVYKNGATKIESLLRRSFDLLSALQSAANTASSADYLYVKIADAVTTDGNGGGLNAYSKVTLHATVNEDVDVRAYEDDSFLLFTQKEKDHITADSSYGQSNANGTASGNRVGASSSEPLVDENDLVASVNHYIFKYNDKKAVIVYQYQISTDHLLSANSLRWHAYMANEILLRLSVDGGITWPYTLYNGGNDRADRYVTVDLLSVDGVRDALLASDGSFCICVSDALPDDGWGAKIHGYEGKVYDTTDGDTVTAKNSYLCKVYPVSMTLEYDANTAGKTPNTVTNEYNYVGEPIYTKVDDATNPYRMTMPSDPNEPLYTGLDTTGTKIQTGRMSNNVSKKNNTTTQADGVYDGNWNGRFNDNNYFVYYYSIAGLDTTRDLTLTLPLGGQFGIKVAVGSSVCPQIVTTQNATTNGNTWGGDAWKPVSNYLAEGGSGNGPNSAMRTYTIDPTSFGDAINTATHIYFMFYDYNADVDPTGGYGARIPLGRVVDGVPTQPITFSYYTQTDVKGIKGASLTLTEDFDVTYSVGDIDADAAPVFSFTLGDDDAKVVTATMEDGKLVAPFENIMPYRMAETITAKLYAKIDGVVHTFENTYSVKDYCARMLEKSTSAELTALLNAILAYGDTAQDYVDYKVDAKPSTGVAGYVAPTATYTAGTYTNYRAVSGTATTATWKSATLLLGSETKVALTFEAADVSGLTVVVNDETVGYTALGNDLYRVEIPVLPNAFNDKLTACFAAAGAVDESYSLTYSVGSYFESRYAISGEPTKAMLDALYNYGVAASAFAN